MSSAIVTKLLAQAEPLAALSLQHLSPRTRAKLASGRLAIASYPNEYGGFIYVGSPQDADPDDADLVILFAVAKEAGLVWLKFDCDAPEVDGLPVYKELESTS